jgi:hypothetical protein
MSEATSVAIVMPVYGVIFPRAALAMASLFAGTLAAGYSTSVEHGITPYVDAARNKLVLDVLAEDPEWTMWTDQDMVLPMDTVPRLMAHGKDVISGIYYKKGPPHFPVCWMWDNLEDGFVRSCWSESDEPMKIGGSGMGCMLVRTQVFKDMKKHFGDEEWFVCRNGRGEDVWFCRRLAEMGIDVWLDPTVECGHVGEYTYGRDDFLRHRVLK